MKRLRMTVSSVNIASLKMGTQLGMTEKQRWLAAFLSFKDAQDAKPRLDALVLKEKLEGKLVICDKLATILELQKKWASSGLLLITEWKVEQYLYLSADHDSSPNLRSHVYRCLMSVNTI